jgi:hypothetical protein
MDTDMNLAYILTWTLSIVGSVPVIAKGHPLRQETEAYRTTAEEPRAAGGVEAINSGMRDGGP